MSDVSPLLRLIATRLLFSIFSLLAVSIIVFSCIELLPGDAAERILGRDSTKVALEVLRQQLHLYDPAPVRYLHWLSGVVRGDFGKSIAANRDVLLYIGTYFERTALLGGLALLMHIPLSLGLGLLTAARREGLVDVFVSVALLVGMSMPEFVTGIIMIILLSNELHLLPPLALIDQAQTPWDAFLMLAMPVVTLNLAMTAYVVRQTRRSMIDVLRSDYIRMAILRGVSPARVIFVHALPNALGPTINAIALNASWLVGGIVVVEVVFNYPGLGRLLVEAISFHDIPLILGAALVLSASYIVLNLIADISTFLLNPKLRTRAA